MMPKITGLNNVGRSRIGTQCVPNQQLPTRSHFVEIHEMVKTVATNSRRSASRIALKATPYILAGPDEGSEFEDWGAFKAERAI